MSEWRKMAVVTLALVALLVGLWVLLNPLQSVVNRDSRMAPRTSCETNWNVEPAPVLGGGRASDTPEAERAADSSRVGRKGDRASSSQENPLAEESTDGGNSAGGWRDSHDPGHAAAIVGYVPPWEGAASDNLAFRKVTDWKVEGEARQRDAGSLLSVVLERATAGTSAVVIDVLMGDGKMGMTANARSEHEGIWSAVFALPLDFALPIFVKIKTADTEFQGLVTRAHMNEPCKIGRGTSRGPSVFVSALPEPSKYPLPRLRCLSPDGAPFAGVAAQFRPIGGAFGTTPDATLLGMSDSNGAIELASLWCAGQILRWGGLMLHAPGFVPVIVTPAQLASAAGGELKVILKNRELVIKAQCRLTPEQIARANKPGPPFAALDFMPLGDPAHLDLERIGKMQHAVGAESVELAIRTGWDFSPLEKLVGRKTRSAENEGNFDEFDPMELLSWYRNQREYDTASGEWRFVLPCHGCYAVPLAVDYDSKGNLRTPLALVIDAREGRTPTITLLAD